MKFFFAFVFMFGIVFANEQTNINIDKFIQELNELPIDERYEKMNDLKIKIKKYDNESKNRILSKLKASSYATKKTMEISDFDLSKYEIDDHKMYNIDITKDIDHTR